jgi:hypothetical protein
MLGATVSKGETGRGQESYKVELTVTYREVLWACQGGNALEPHPHPDTHTHTHTHTHYQSFLCIREGESK